MNLEEYQQAATLTAVYPNAGANLIYATLGLCGEAGEIANKVKKIQRDHDGTLPSAMHAQLVDELGDVLWYAAAMARELGVNLGDVARANIEKLRARKAAGTLKGSGDHR